jgi:hypothetical protein
MIYRYNKAKRNKSYFIPDEAIFKNYKFRNEYNQNVKKLLLSKQWFNNYLMAENIFQKMD